MQFTLQRLLNRVFCRRSLPIHKMETTHNSQLPPQLLTLRSRTIYTQTDTGILEFESFKKITEKATRLPNFLETCPYMTQEDVETLFASFPEIVEDFLSFPRVVLPLGNKRTRKVLQHVLCYTPYAMAQTVMAHKFYAKQRIANNTASNEAERFVLAQKLGWALEMILRQLCVLDDVIDSCERRNGFLAWHMLPGNAKQAAQDATILGCGACLIITKYFKHLDCYADLMNAAFTNLYDFQMSELELHEMQEIQKKGCEVFDPIASWSHLKHVRCDLNGGVISNVSVIPAMIYNGYNDPEIIKTALDIGDEVSVAAIMFDDIGDCYGDNCVTGRTTTDIAGGKQTFLLYRARELASSEQLLCLQENYGKKDIACVEKVKKIYEELNIKEDILKMATEVASQVEDKISKLPQETYPCFIWHNILRIYGGVGLGTSTRI